jgi:hypothetical protein
MNLLMTGGMEQHTVFSSIRSTFGPPKNVMAMPSRNLRAFLVADWAQPLLLLPSMQKPPFPFQPGSHLDIQAFLKIRFPDRIVGIGFCADFRMSFNTN